MNVLIVNPIIYTSETKNIKKAPSIKDTMIYDLCLGFKEAGVNVTLVACEDFRPDAKENYPFDVIWMKSKLKKLCPVNTLPFCPEVKKIVRNGNFDLIISSEVFSLNTLMLVLRYKKNLIVWHELAKHNKIFKGIPSRLWYGVVARLFFRNSLIIPRSIEAKEFISQFCNNVTDEIIDHGVNTDKFRVCLDKDNCFCVSSQLIPRKRINKIIDAFVDYLEKYDNTCKLYIMGEGEDEQKLKAQAVNSGYGDNIIFTGKLQHGELVKILQSSMAMLVYTEKDNNMVSIVESIAVGTPIITTSVPYNATYIKANALGIVDDEWGCEELKAVSDDKTYVLNCNEYRKKLSTLSKAELFINAKNSL